MANISVTTLHSDCRSPCRNMAPEVSATSFSAEDIPTPFDRFWNVLGSPLVVAHVSKHPVHGDLYCKIERRSDTTSAEQGLQTHAFNVILTTDQKEIHISVNPERVRQEVDYVCRGSVCARYSDDVGVTRKDIRSWVRMVGCALRVIHESVILDYKFGLVTLEFEFINHAEVARILKSPMSVDTTLQEMDFDKSLKCKIVTMRKEESIWCDINYGIFVDRQLELKDFELRYYHGVENVCETVLRCFASKCVARFEPFLEHCDLVGVISNCENREHQRITIVTTAEHLKVHQWPNLKDLQNLRLICELEDQILDIGLMLEVEPEFYQDRVDYTCKGTLLGGFLSRTILKEWTDIFESAVAYLHNSSHSVCEPYGEFKIVFYGDFATLRAKSLTSIVSECPVQVENDLEKPPKQVHFSEASVDDDRNCVSPVLARRVVTRNREYRTLPLKQKMILRNNKTVYFNSKKHFDLVVFVRNFSEEKLNLDLLSTRTVLRKDSKIVWPCLDSPESPTELVVLLCKREPAVTVIIFKRHSESISYYYGIAPFSLSDQESEIRDIVEDVVSHFHDLHVAPRGFSIKCIQECDPADGNFQCLSKISLSRPDFRQRWMKRLEVVLGYIKELL